MSNRLTRARMGAVLATAAMTSSAIMFAGGGAQAAAPAGHSATVRAAAPASAERPVLKNEYGTAKSHIRGTFGKRGTVTGTFTPKRFAIPTSGPNAGKLMAVGKVRATLTRATGKVVGTDTAKVHIPVMTANGSPLPTSARALGSCDILNLVLGPLDLDLLGLQVHLDKVVLNIVAQSGAGNLLGNLLCAVAGLLDNTGVLTQIQQILNSILAILNL